MPSASGKPHRRIVVLTIPPKKTCDTRAKAVAPAQEGSPVIIFSLADRTKFASPLARSAIGGAAEPASQRRHRCACSACLHMRPPRAEDLTNLPATCVATGALELFVDQNLKCAQTELRGGVPVQLRVYPGAFLGTRAATAATCCGAPPHARGWRRSGAPYAASGCRRRNGRKRGLRSSAADTTETRTPTGKISANVIGIR